jgi:hypothetical protein
VNVTTEAATAVQEDAPRARLAGILREIAVGGLAAIIAGVVVGGIGGRFVMRLATLLAPDTVGRLTANGNRIGAFTIDGSLLLLFFGGAVAGVVAASIWVVARPWLPAKRSRRALASVPLALAFGTPILIEADNPDFDILGHDPVIVAALIILVAITGPFTVLLDDWLGRRLPAATSGREPAVGLYALIAVIGLLLTAAVTVPLMFQLGGLLAIMPIVAVGIVTLVLWDQRLRGDPPGPEFRVFGRGVLWVAVAIGLAAAVGQVVGALGLE